MQQTGSGSFVGPLAGKGCPGGQEGSHLERKTVADFREPSSG